jgi:hypothetical protein
MIFVPFTGVDHHKKCVTFGAGLICDETIESYLWLLETFVKAHPKHPMLVLTDQDAAMRQAVITIFPNSPHRLCMWHIMNKLPAKVHVFTHYINAPCISSCSLLTSLICLQLKGCNVDNEALRRGIHELVWDLIIDTEDFEQRWTELLEEYDLSDHTWLTDMYDIRHRWVPCYFKHIDMCCLMKTTSRCESSNAMFKVNTNSSNTLLQFLMCFDTALDGQRHKQRELEFSMMTTTPTMLTGSPIEQHASEVYTPALFLEVQREILRGMFSCSIGPSTVGGDVKLYTVVQYNQKCVAVCNFEVIQLLTLFFSFFFFNMSFYCNGALCNSM